MSSFFYRCLGNDSIKTSFASKYTIIKILVMLLKQFAKNTKTFCWGYIWGMQESMDCIKAKFITTNIFQTRTNVPFHVDINFQLSLLQRWLATIMSSMEKNSKMMKC